MSKVYWSNEETLTALSLRDDGIPIHQIAKTLEKPLEGVRAKFRRIQDGSDAIPEKVENVERKCLKCHSDFTADGRFERICRPCKSTLEWRYVA